MLALNFLRAKGNSELLILLSASVQWWWWATMPCDAVDLAHNFVCAEQEVHQLRHIFTLPIHEVSLHLSVEACPIM